LVASTISSTLLRSRWHCPGCSNPLNPGSDKTRDLYLEHFGNLDTPIPEFVHGAAAHVKVIDLETSLPELFATDAIGE
jgi:hypothetical protein